MAIPNKFENAGDAIVASYSFEDIAEGTGVVQYYGLRGQSSGAVFYTLNQNITYPDEEHNGNVEDGAVVNFDMGTLNFPRIIEGVLYITGQYVGGVAGNVGFTPQKVSNSVVTELAGTKFSSFAATHSFFIDFTIPKTKLKRGDYFRMAVEVFGGAANEGLHVNSEDATFPPFKVFVPYRIDL